MSNISLRVRSVRVSEGQGLEGDFELRIRASDGTHSVLWPSLNTWTKVDNGGVAHVVDMLIGTYNVSSGTLSKRVDLEVTEVDGGFNGGDDEGSKALTFELTPNMAVSTKTATVSLKRPNMKFLGKVVIEVTAQQGH